MRTLCKRWLLFLLGVVMVTGYRIATSTLLTTASPNTYRDIFRLTAPLALQPSTPPAAVLGKLNGIVNLAMKVSESHHETYHIDSANLYE